MLVDISGDIQYFDYDENFSRLCFTYYIYKDNFDNLNVPILEQAKLRFKGIPTKLRAGIELEREGTVMRSYCGYLVPVSIFKYKHALGYENGYFSFTCGDVEVLDDIYYNSSWCKLKGKINLEGAFNHFKKVYKESSINFVYDKKIKIASTLEEYSHFLSQAITLKHLGSEK